LLEDALYLFNSLRITKKLNEDPTRKKIKAKAKLNAYSQK